MMLIHPETGLKILTLRRHKVRLEQTLVGPIVKILEETELETECGQLVLEQNDEYIIFTDFGEVKMVRYE